MISGRIILGNSCLPNRWDRLVLLISLLVFSQFSLIAQKAELVVHTGHTAQVHSVAVSPDGLTIASGSSDRTVRLWDAVTGKLLRTLSGHTGDVFAVAFSPNSQIVASGGRAGEIRLWGRNTGAVIATFHSELDTVASLAFNPKSPILASGGVGQKIQFWNLLSKQEIPGPVGSYGDPMSIVFSPDGKTLASVHKDLALRLWNTENGSLTGEFPILRAYGESIAFSPNGKTVAVGDVQGHVKVVDAFTGSELWNFVENPSGMASLSFSPDGKNLAAGSAMGGITILDAKDGAKILNFPKGDPTIGSIAYYPDGLSIVSASFWEIKIWNPRTGELIGHMPETSSSVNSVAFASQDYSFAFGSRIGGIKLFKESSGELTTIMPYQSTMIGLGPMQGTFVDNTLSPLLFSPNGEMLASEGWGKLKLWDIKTGAELRSFGKTWPRAFAFSPSGSALAIGYDDGTIQIWNPANRIEIENPSLLLKGAVRSISFSPDGRLLAFSDGEEVKVWDVNENRVTLQLPIKSTARIPVLFGPKNEVLALISDSGIAIRDLATNKTSQIPVTGVHVQTMAFSPNGERLAIGTWEKDVRIYEIASGKESHRFDGHSSHITSLAFSANGRMLLSGSNDGTAKLWNVDSKAELCTIVAVGLDDWVVIKPDGRFDTNKALDNIEGLHWVVSDQPLTPIPLDIFMRQYYEPGLLGRLLKCNKDGNCDREFKPLPAIGQINRVQPLVTKPRVSVPLKK